MTRETRRARRTFAVQVASLSLLALPLTVLMLILAGLVFPGATDGPVVEILAPIAVLATPIGVALWIWGRPLILAVIFSVVMFLLGGVLGTSFALVRPERFFDFAPGILLIVALSLAVVASIAALAGRGNEIERAPSSRSRAALRAVCAVAAVAIFASAALDLAQGPVVVSTGEATEVVTARDLFLPTEFKMNEGQRVSFRVRNQDSYAHTFSIDELKIDEYIGPLADKTVSFTARTEGGDPLRLYCAINGHESMVGRLFVEP
jgi:plastocyanin